MGQSRRGAKVLMGALFIIIGVGLLAGAVAFGTSKRAFIREATIADGVVSRLNAGGSHPQIEFTTASGQRIEYPQGGLIFGYHPGDRVRVLYKHDDPSQSACIDAFGALWFTPILLCVLGFPCLIGGLLSVTGRGV